MSRPLAAALVVIVVAAFLYEIAQVASGRPTISQQVWAFVQQWPPISLLVGILIGHLFTVNGNSSGSR